ncbi:MAG: M20/M25/M40 family metallo-hydrolase, partial [Pseudomonadota bacterium]|nr:M20/M25/M40 family metallo-hydrolase [Pseudomonadota bacterium]
MKPDTAPQALLAAIDADTMLREVQDWAAINTGTGNIAGLDRMARILADAFSTLPGDVELVEPATVTAISPEGREYEKPHGKHMVLRVRPEADRRFVLTGHMDTVFPEDHPFQQVSWLDDDTINGPGTADMKGGLNVILHALKTFETMEGASRVGYDVMINSDEETGSLASRTLIEELARGKYAALTYEPSALPDGTLAHARGGTGNYSITITGKSA